MESIEKNDVEIVKLFDWKNSYRLFDDKGNDFGRVYIRLAGDADINKARVFALRESAVLRKKLNNPESDERLAYIPDLDTLEDEQLVKLLLGLYVREYSKTAVEEIKIPLPKEPDSDANLEEQEKYQKTVDEYPSKRLELITQFITSGIEREEERIRKETRENNYKEFIRLSINLLCENQMITRYREMCVYLNTYKDKKLTKRLFENFDEFDNLRTSIKDQLLGYYTDLEIDMATLKK